MYLLFPALIYIYNVGHFLLIILLLKKIIYRSYYFITSSLAFYLNVSLPFFMPLQQCLTQCTSTNGTSSADSIQHMILMVCQ